MENTVINLTTHLDKFEIVKYQLMNYCFVNKIVLNETQLNSLAVLGEVGKISLTRFGELLVERKLYGNPISANNCLYKIDKRLFVKEVGSKKSIFLNPALNIKSEGNILINVKLIKVETNAGPKTVSKGSREAQPA
jgi:hypothetical protein